MAPLGLELGGEELLRLGLCQQPHVGFTRSGWGWMEASLPWAGSPRAQWDSLNDGPSPRAGSSLALPRRHSSAGTGRMVLEWGPLFLDIHTSFGDWRWQVGLSGCLESAYPFPSRFLVPQIRELARKREPSYSEPQRGRRQSGGREQQKWGEPADLGGFHLVLSPVGLTALVFLGQISPKRQMYSRWVSAAPSHFRTGLFSASKSQPAPQPVARGGEAGLLSPVQAQSWGLWVSPVVSHTALISP